MSESISKHATAVGNEERIEAAYADKAKNYSDGLIQSLIFGPYLRRPAVEALDPKPSDSILILGVGTGNEIPLIQKQAGDPEHLPTIIGVDISGTMLAQAQKERYTADAHQNVNLIQADGRHIPLADDSVDKSICVLGLSQTEPFAMLCEMIRVTKHGGRVVVADLHTSDKEGFKLMNKLIQKMDEGFGSTAASLAETDHMFDSLDTLSHNVQHNFLKLPYMSVAVIEVPTSMDEKMNLMNTLRALKNQMPSATK